MSKVSLKRLSAALGLMWTVALTAQSAPKVDPTTLGPKVGERAPAFTLPDQDGRGRPLQSLLGPSGMLLVFSRSADW